MRQVTLTHAQQHLPELLEEVARGERLVITRDDQPAGTLGPPPASAATSNGRGRSLLDIESFSVGGIIKPFTRDDDLLDEMLNG